ncbi:hypothetical protein E2C01_056525 [Portunus trituberculatus]|uniref:Secreted protein n=1 Tax=Portunus trituberculatus TaxID=210409 RepID=A0A5B7GR11_PORTR|nr:hypothetical protein [Portunus trituberculatus]
MLFVFTYLFTLFCLNVIEQCTVRENTEEVEVGLCLICVVPAGLWRRRVVATTSNHSHTPAHTPPVSVLAAPVSMEGPVRRNNWQQRTLLGGHLDDVIKMASQPGQFQHYFDFPSATTTSATVKRGHV